MRGTTGRVIAAPVALIAVAALLGALVAAVSLARPASGAPAPEASAAAAKLTQRLNRLQRQVAQLRKRVNRVNKVAVNSPQLPSPPSGPAGGALTGTYPNPQIAPGAVSTGMLDPSIPAARVTGPAVQIPNNQVTTLSFDVLRFDTATLWAPSNPTVLTAPVNGVYAITAQVFWAGNASGTRQLEIILDGSELVALEAIDGSADGVGQSTTTVVDMGQGESVSVRVRQTSGNQLELLKEGMATPDFSMVWLAPGV